MPITPMRLLRIPEPFDHPEFVFEPKIDGFRALAYVLKHHLDRAYFFPCACCASGQRSHFTLKGIHA